MICMAIYSHVATCNFTNSCPFTHARSSVRSAKKSSILSMYIYTAEFIEVGKRVELS